MPTDLVTAVQNITDLPGAWLAPDLLHTVKDTDTTTVTEQIAPRILDLLTTSDEEELRAIIDTTFHAEGFWRDQVCLTWNMRTFHRRGKIVENIIPLIKRSGIKPESVKLLSEQTSTISLPNGVSCVRLAFSFATDNPEASCTLSCKVLNLVDVGYKVFTATTALTELGAAPWQPVAITQPDENSNNHHLDKLPEKLDVLVVGGGHGGLAISAYLKSMGIDFAVIDKEPEIGDSWAKRYESATLHTTRVFSGLPYFPFPTDYPLYVPAHLIAKHYYNYAKCLRLPAYCGREATKASWDEERQSWTVEVQGPNGVEKTTVTNLVFAVGIGGRRPVYPDFAGKDVFKGEQLHSATYTNAKPWKGKKVVIIGAATTACDIALDCAQEKIDVTMVQRGPTRIYPDSHTAISQLHFWNDKAPAELGDVASSEDPLVLQAALSAVLLDGLKRKHDPAYYSGLQKAGFLAITDGAVHQQIFCRGGHHYPDVGACEAINRGQIKVKSGSAVETLTETGLEFSDGTVVDADVICYATGFEKDNRAQIAEIIGQSEASKLEPVWGLNSEGEVRGVWRPSGHEGIFIQGGELQTMRYYGRCLALQIAAKVRGVRPEPYRD